MAQSLIGARYRSWRSAVSVRGALLLLVAVAFLAGILPAGVVLDRLVARELERRVNRDLSSAPTLVAARDAALHDAMMMHAKELAHESALAAALRARDREHALAIVEPNARAYNYHGVLIGPDGTVWTGPAGSDVLAEETRAGEMPVRVVTDETGLHLVSVAPVMLDGNWLGAAGVSLPLDGAAAGALAALTHSDLVLIVGDKGQGTTASSDTVLAAKLATAWSGSADADSVREIDVDGARFLVSNASLDGATALFVRDLRRETAMRGMLRRVVLITGAGALALALLLGYVLAGWLARPVRDLASAADRLSGGDFEAPLPSSSVREVARVTDSFAEMRRTLAFRLAELRSANRLLEERQARLSALQSELIKRERVATSARMATELAHEIRNPVANIRNCLELLERRLGQDAEGREFAALAIDELLRMHELAERMLHLNRPREPEVGTCDAIAIAQDVIALTELGNGDAPMEISLDAEGPIEVAMPADALKQVLLNLVQNAREAVRQDPSVQLRIWKSGRNVHITVRDNGPGIPAQLRERVFDPFFTTRANTGGVGLGLFLVEGIVRGHGGNVSLRSEEVCACFELTIPAAEPAEGGAVSVASAVQVAAKP